MYCFFSLMSKVCNFICDSTYEIVSFRYVLVVQSQGTSGLPGTYCLVNVPVAEANVLPQADCSNTEAKFQLICHTQQPWWEVVLSTGGGCQSPQGGPLVQGAQRGCKHQTSSASEIRNILGPFHILGHAGIKAYYIQRGKLTEVAKKRKLTSRTPDHAPNPLRTGMSTTAVDRGSYVPY